MTEFFKARDVRATRKEHRCCACTKIIPKGSASFYFSMKQEGELWSGHYHTDCRAAEIALNDLHDLCGDEWLSLNDLDEPDDKQWLVENHPAVASRLGLGVM